MSPNPECPDNGAGSMPHKLSRHHYILKRHFNREDAKYAK